MGTGPRVQPSLVPALALAVAAVGHIVLDVPEGPPGGYWPGATLVVLGAGLFGWAVHVQMQAGTHPEIGHATTALVTRGPYSMSRNPIYVAFLLVQTGIGLMLAWWIALVLLPIAAWTLHRYVVLPEEAWLSQRFGQNYDQYREATRRWL